MGNIRVEQLRNKWKVTADGGIRKNFQYKEDAMKYAETLGYMEAAVNNKITLEDLKNIKYVEEEQEMPETEDASTQENSEEEGLSSEESGGERIQQAEENPEPSEEEPHSGSQSW